MPLPRLWELCGFMVVYVSCVAWQHIRGIDAIAPIAHRELQALQNGATRVANGSWRSLRTILVVLVKNHLSRVSESHVLRRVNHF